MVTQDYSNSLSFRIPHQVYYRLYPDGARGSKQIHPHYFAGARGNAFVALR